MVTFARWEEGFVVAPGNPKRVRNDRGLGAEERPVCESRAWFGKPRVAGPAYGESQDGRGEGPGIRPDRPWSPCSRLLRAFAGSRCLPGDTVRRSDLWRILFPCAARRYDLVMRKRTADLPAVKAFLDVLQRATLRRKLEVLAGYDTSQTGTLVA